MGGGRSFQVSPVGPLCGQGEEQLESSGALSQDPRAAGFSFHLHPISPHLVTWPPAAGETGSVAPADQPRVQLKHRGRGGEEAWVRGQRLPRCASDTHIAVSTLLSSYHPLAPFPSETGPGSWKPGLPSREQHLPGWLLAHRP